jgi:hypothetical protein
VLITAVEIGGWWVSKYPWFNSPAYLRIFWSTQLILSILRLLMIIEIARRSLRAYPAVWSFAWWALSAAGAVLLSWTAYSVAQNVHHFKTLIAVGGQRFEFMQAILLLLLLALGSYYQLRIPPLYRLIVIGMCIYSAVQMSNSELYLLKSPRADLIFGYIRQGSYPISLVIWVYAVWRWGATPAESPELISQSAYDKISPQIHDRLRELNDKLSDLTGKRRR